MNAIATSVDDSFQRMRDKLAAEKLRPHHAMDPYFYRSHLVHEQELEHLIFKSWIYALHASEIPSAGDYQLVEIGEEFRGPLQEKTKRNPGPSVPCFSGPIAEYQK